MEVMEFTPVDRILEKNLTKYGKGEVFELTPTVYQKIKVKSTLQKKIKSLEINSIQAGTSLGTIKNLNSQELKENPNNVIKETEEATRKRLAKKINWETIKK